MNTSKAIEVLASVVENNYFTEPFDAKHPRETVPVPHTDCSAALKCLSEFVQQHSMCKLSKKVSPLRGESKKPREQNTKKTHTKYVKKEPVDLKGATAEWFTDCDEPKEYDLLKANFSVKGNLDVSKYEARFISSKGYIVKKQYVAPLTEELQKLGVVLTTSPYTSKVKVFTRAREKWTDEETLKLCSAFESGSDLAALSSSHCRTINAVKEQLVKNGKMKEQQ